jgi:peptide/nickel transport system substrate-binding protein
MTSHPRAAWAALLLGTAPVALSAQVVEPTTPPPAPEFAAQGLPVFVNRDEILSFRALPEYSEPPFVTAFVEAGLLPPVEERLPAEPMVYAAANMPDGLGTYGDVLRHVIGGRPEGWNYWAGLSQGWGGIDIGLSECLTRTGPLFTVNAEDLQPLPEPREVLGVERGRPDAHRQPHRGSPLVGRRRLRHGRHRLLLEPTSSSTRR